MKKKIMKSITLIIALSLVCLIVTSVAFAYVPYTAYNFDFYGEIVNGPAGYVPDEVLFGEDIGVGELINPADMFIDSDGETIVIVDQGAAGSRARIILLDSNFKLIKTIEKFVDENTGEAVVVDSPGGLCMDDENNIYLCDPDNARVLKMNQDGVVSLYFTAPPKEYVDSSFKYFPNKLGIGINGSIYVISKGGTDGIMEFDENGTFVRFFGAPEVQLDASDLLQIYWRNIYRTFAGDSVDAYFATYVPQEFANLTIDDNGFVYTMIPASDESINEVYKLNFQGSNILDPTQKSTTKQNDNLSANYGDLITRSTKTQGNIFEDICLDDDGFFSLLDRNLGKIFEYDKEGNLIFVYGNKGNQVNQVQEGLLVDPSAIIKVGKKTVVLDYLTGAITIYSLSDYGKELHTAVNYYNQGKYDEAETPWKNVLKFDANSELAHIGLGKVHYLRGNYAEALNEFKLGNDRNNYSRTFKLYRDDLIRSNFGWVIAIILVLLAVLIVWKKYGRKIKASVKSKKGGDQ